MMRTKKFSHPLRSNHVGSSLLCLLLIVGGAWPLLSQPETENAIEGSAVETEETDLIRRMKERLGEDASARERLAQRILNSSLSAHLTVSKDAAQAASEADEWIRTHPEEAAQLAVGFARDDHDGTHAFEQSLYVRVERYFELNPKRYRGILGMLTAAGRESKRIAAPQKIPEEEQREILKNVFEGTGSQTTKVLSERGASEKKPETHAGASGPATFAGTGLYDRLSALNPSGYSPNVVAYQSALNAEHVPGAPRLIETGRLDYPTLIHPYHALRYDIDQLALQLRRHRAWALAKMLGVEKTMRPQDYDDPALLRQMEKVPKRRTLPPAFARRQAALDRASRALIELRLEAEKAKNPPQITTGLLRAIGSKQKESARWIAAASIEADLQRLEDKTGFWSEELKSKIHAAPAPENVRNAYLEQGDKLNARLIQIQECDRRTLSCLESSGYLACWPETQRLLGGVEPLRKNLDRDIGLIAAVPYRLGEAWRPKSAWRDFIDRWARRLMPNSDYVRRLDRADSGYKKLYEVFAKIAAGDFWVADKIMMENSASASTPRSP